MSSSAHDAPMDSGQSASRSSMTGSTGSPIEVDSFPNTDDDASGNSYGDATVSVTSNVWKFDKENGRTYHGYRSGVYFYPNDASETERLDYQYQVIQEALSHKLHFAPLNSPETILDIGTGTGAWAIEMGDAYPEANIEATDLSPIQPDAVPENVQFIIDDAAEDDWAVPSDHYDFIHTRIMMGSFEDFRDVIRKGFRYTKPGGWMESQDVMHPPFSDDGTMPPDWPFREWSQYIEDAAKQADRPLRIANKLKRWYIEAGFVDVQEKVIKLPINTWPRDKQLKVLGQWWAENLLSGLQGFSLALLSRVFSWSKEEIEVYLVNVRKAIADRRVHAYHKFYTVWGRKPMKDEVVPPREEQLAASRSNAPTDPSSKATPPQPPPGTRDAKVEAEPEPDVKLDAEAKDDDVLQAQSPSSTLGEPLSIAGVLEAGRGGFPPVSGVLESLDSKNYISAPGPPSAETGYPVQAPSGPSESAGYPASLSNPTDHDPSRHSTAPGSGSMGYRYASQQVVGVSSSAKDVEQTPARVWKPTKYEARAGDLPPSLPPPREGDNQ